MINVRRNEMSEILIFVLALVVYILVTGKELKKDAML
jgi:hypothetical protein